MDIRYFPKPENFRKWMEKNHDREKEIWVGFYKKSTGKPSIDWSESVDVALCFGWIDGVRKSIDGESYKIRFTPRKKDSIWSAINIRKVEELQQKGLMHPAGLAAFSHRKEERSRVYSFEQEEFTLDAASEKTFRKNKKAWESFMAMAPSYRKAAIWWVISAKKEETKQKRLETLISDSEAGLRIASLRPRK